MAALTMAVADSKPFALGAAIRAAKGGNLAVVSVVADGPCARAGVRKGDAVLAVEGEHIHSLDELANRLAFFAHEPFIAVTIRSARTGREADVLLHRLGASDKRSTGDVAEALRKIASSAGQSPRMRGVSTDQQHRHSGQPVQAAASRTALQDISNDFVQPVISAANSSNDNASWIVSFAPGTSSEITPCTLQKSPGKTTSRAGGSPAKKGSRSGPSPKKSAARVRFGQADTEHVFAALSPTPSDTALTVASPASPPPHLVNQNTRSKQNPKQTCDDVSAEAAAQARENRIIQTDSPLPEISGGSMLLRHSLSISPASSVGRSQVCGILASSSLLISAHTDADPRDR